MAVDICPLFRKKGGTPMDQLVLIIVLLIIMELKQNKPPEALKLRRFISNDMTKGG